MVRVQTRPILCATAVLGLWSLAAAAQQGQQGPGQPPAEAPSAKPAPQATPPPKAVKPSETPAGSVADSLVGLGVFSSDGTRVGEVRSVDTRPGGEVAALRVRTGGFLGFGGRTIAIPKGQFMRKGDSIRLDLDADEVNELPEVQD